MRKIELNFLQGDEILGKAVFDDEGRILLREGVILKRTFIVKLMGLGINAVYIDDEISRGIELNDVVAEQTRQDCKHAVAEMMKKCICSENMSLKSVICSAQRVIDDILSEREVMINLVEIRSQEEQLFSHSVNVCVLAVMTGVNKGYSPALLKELATGALLHDIGMSKILKEKVTGKGRLEIDMSRYREHPKLGYEILNRQEISSYVKTIALAHHENCDGSGFPRGLKKSEIHEMVRIVSLCNAFDGIVHGEKRFYNLPPYQAAEFVMSSPHLFDSDLAKLLLANVAMYPAGSLCLLSDGRRCIVVRQNVGLPSRPVVRVLGEEKSEEIDLAKALKLFIEKAEES